LNVQAKIKQENLHRLPELAVAVRGL